MASTSFQKRALEMKRKEKAEEKEARRAERKVAREAFRPSVEGEDPDLIGIVAGPQPIPEED